jgi:hypothetical protein
MSDADTIPYGLGASPRRHRIAELLHKAMLQADAHDALDLATSTEAEPESVSSDIQSDLPDTERVVQFLRVTGAASPASIRSSLGLSRTGAFRVLQSLAHSRRVVTHGQTRTLVYRLNEREPSPDKLELN